MGNYDSPTVLGLGVTGPLPAAVVVVASGQALVPLRGGPGAELFGPASLVPLDAGDPVPDGAIRLASILVLEVDPDDRASLRRISQVRVSRPDLPLIAAVRGASVSLTRTLVREGVNDVAVLPFVPAELASQILDAAAVLGQKHSPQSAAPATCVVRGSGGSGATTVLTHMALAMAEAGAASTCLVDLDLQGSSVSSYLGLREGRPVTDLLELGEGLDRDVVRTSAVDSGRGFFAITGPEMVAPVDTVDTDRVLHLLAAIRAHFGEVLIDLPAAWTDWTLSITLSAQRVLVVTDLSIGGLRQARRRIDLLRSVGLDDERIKVVVNRVERRLFHAVSTQEVSDTLGCEVIASLHNEGPALSAAQDQGLLLPEVSHKSRFANEIRDLVTRIRS